MCDFIQVDGYLQKLRTEASNNAINLFKLELKSEGGHNLFMCEFDNMYDKYCGKACDQFEKDCDYFVENCPRMTDLINRNKPRHLQKLKDHMEMLKDHLQKFKDHLQKFEDHLQKLKEHLVEFKTEVLKLNQLKRDQNFERLKINLIRILKLL